MSAGRRRWWALRSALLGRGRGQELPAEGSRSFNTISTDSIISFISIDLTFRNQPSHPAHRHSQAQPAPQFPTTTTVHSLAVNKLIWN